MTEVRLFFLYFNLCVEAAKRTSFSAFYSEISEVSFCTIDGSFARQDYNDELQPGVGVLQVSEHRLHAVGSLGVFTETRLALDGHPSIL